MKRFLMNMLYTAIVALIASVGVVALLKVIGVEGIGSSPEMTLARNTVASNTEVIARFGKLNDIEYKRGKGGYIERSARGVEGRHYFEIKGTKEAGLVFVDWRSKGDGQQFTPLRIALVESFKDAVTIWQAPDEMLPAEF